MQLMRMIYKKMAIEYCNAKSKFWTAS